MEFEQPCSPEFCHESRSFCAPVESEDRTEGDFSHKAKGYSLYDWLEMRGAAGTLLVGGAVGAAVLLLARACDRNGKKASLRHHTAAGAQHS